MLEDRRLEVLRAIVEDYVATQEPVGSRALVERHALGVSSATVRNDMAALEDEGYIMQPHTSAGRIPTTRGYRLFVDRLTAVKPLSAAERRAIEAFLAGPVNLDDVVARTVRLLAQLTRQAAVVQYPVLTRSSVTHVELVALSTTRLMVVVITSTGRVDQRVVEVPDTTDVAGLGELRAAINARLGGRRFAEVPALLDDLAPAATLSDATLSHAAAGDAVRPGAATPVGAATPLTRVVVDTLRDMLVEQRDTRVVLAGTANLAHLSDFQGSLTAVLEALEEHVVLMRLLGEASAGSGVTVRIGDETRHEGLRGASIVSAAYGPHGESVGALGVLGPVRMDYPGTMGAVRAVARYLGRILTEG